MSTNYPLVSIYIPTKNRLSLLKLAIQSVISQTYPNIELLIVDDGSTDGTPDYLTQLKIHSFPLKVFRNEISKGACAARNIAIENANGEFVTGLDDDDIFLPHRIQSLVDAYCDKYAFVCSSMYWDYGKKKKVIDAKALEITLDKQLSYNEATSQILVKRERILAVGGFNESFVSCQDYDLWTRLIIKYGSAYRIAKPSYIINDTSNTQRTIGNPASVKGYLQYLEEYRSIMNRNNMLNQEFMRIRRAREVLSLRGLIKQIGSGYFYSKLRYFLSSNFSFIQKLHKSFYR